LRNRTSELRDVEQLQNQVMAQIELFTTREYDKAVYTLPNLDEKVARLHLRSWGELTR